MSQQQNHNTNETSPFQWQLDPTHWQRSREAARFEAARFFEAAQQHGGEYFCSDSPPFDLLSPMETTVWVWNPLCMALGHYCPLQPRRIIVDVPICPHAGPAPGTYLDPIFCYGPPFMGPSEVMNGCPDLWPQHEESGQECFSPYGPLPPHPPPMPFFGLPQQPGQEHVYPGGPPAPHHPPMPMPFWQPPLPPSSPTQLPFCPEACGSPAGSSRACPHAPTLRPPPRTMYWSTECYQNTPEPPESPVTEGASRPPSPLSALRARRAARMRRHSWS
ncbi:hypothetical protein LA080_010486 [Diaporthe eres]|nr:hypothetical protein LA080_010486 [Diaporthe eres]